MLQCNSKLAARNERIARVALYILICLVLQITSIGQEPITHFSHYTVQNGLPDNRVNCILQDQAGFIWAGTNNGLSRFDGHEFFVYQKNSTKNSISGNVISALCEDSEGHLWIGTSDGGLCRMNKDRSSTKEIDLSAFSIKAKKISTIYFDATEPCIYFGLDNGGLFKCDLNGDNTIRLAISRENMSVYAILRTSQGLLFSQPGQSILSWKDEKENPSLDSKKFPSPSGTITCFLRDSKSRIWFGAWSPYLFQMESFNGNYSSIPLSNNEISKIQDEVTCLEEDGFGQIWIGTKQGNLFLYNDQSGVYKKYTSERTNPFSIKGTVINDLCKDRDGRIWVATDSGINLADPFNSSFDVTWLSKEDDCLVNCFLECNHHLLIGTSKGMYVRNQEGDESLISFNVENEEESVSALYKAGNGNVYVGTSRTIYLFDTLNFKAIPLRLPKSLCFDHEHIQASRVNAITEITINGKQEIIAFVYGYGALLIREDEVFFVHLIQNNEIENLVHEMVCDDQNRIWLCGASQGLSLLNPESIIHPTQEALKQHCTESSYQSLSIGNGFSNVYQFLPTNNGGYFSTPGNGVQLLDLSTDKVQISSLEVPENGVLGISLGSENGLWMITSKGIGLFNLVTKNYQNFGYESGVPLIGLGGYFYRSPQTYLYAGGNGFYVRFNPDKPAGAHLIPKALFTHVSVKDEAADSLLSFSQIQLSGQEAYIKFTCSALQFTLPQLVTFHYWMEGLNENWIDNGTNNVLAFSGLPYGKYTLHMKTKSADGIWSAHEAIVRLVIPPRFYQTWWFLLLGIAFFCIVAYAIYRNRIHRFQEIEKMRNHIARDLHDDVGSALGSISYLSAAAEKQIANNQISAVGVSIQKMGSTSREMVERMHDIVWAVRSENDTFHELLMRLKTHATDLAAANEIRLQFSFNEDLKNVALSMIEKKNTFLIAKEALYNSLKYSGCTNWYIHFDSYSDGKFKAEIRDDGIGFTNEKNKMGGVGLRSMSLRAKEMNATLEVNSQVGKGTQIRLFA